MNGGTCLAELCGNWTGQGCICAALDIEPTCGPCQVGDHTQCGQPRGATRLCCCFPADGGGPATS